MRSGGSLDTTKHEADLHPGQWRYTDATGTRVGNLPSGDAALWDFIARADARFGIVEDAARWAALMAKQRKGK